MAVTAESEPAPQPASQLGRGLRLDALQRKLGYAFEDVNLLVRALTHKSASAGRSNERLEYLGDAVLSYVVAAHLHEALAQAPESALTLGRAALVKGGALAEIAQSLGLGAHLAVGVGEMRSAEHLSASILADALEALIGAVHEDGGIEAARALVVRLWKERLAGAPAAAKDAKSALQEFVQARALPLPAYAVVEQTGPKHTPRFVVACEVAALRLLATGTAGSRKQAEQRAAAAVLSQAGAADGSS